LIDVEDSLPERLHPAVDHAINELKKDIERGSFWRVTAAFKSLDHDLVEKVDQVRRYRNWVVHGRRGKQPDSIKLRRGDPLLQGRGESPSLNVDKNERPLESRTVPGNLFILLGT
jgi:hypothetical protein